MADKEGREDREDMGDMAKEDMEEAQEDRDSMGSSNSLTYCHSLAQCNQTVPAHFGNIH